MHLSHWQQLWNKVNKHLLNDFTNMAKMYMYQSCSHFKTSEYFYWNCSENQKFYIEIKHGYF